MKPHPVSEPQNRKESPGLHGPIHAVAPAMVACHQQTLSHAGQCPVLPPRPGPAVVCTGRPRCVAQAAPRAPGT